MPVRVSRARSDVPFFAAVSAYGPEPVTVTVYVSAPVPLSGKTVQLVAVKLTGSVSETPCRVTSKLSPQFFAPCQALMESAFAPRIAKSDTPGATGASSVG